MNLSGNVGLMDFIYFLKRLLNYSHKKNLVFSKVVAYKVIKSLIYVIVNNCLSYSKFKKVVGNYTSPNKYLF